MILSKDMYMPILAWRTGEYQALWSLKESIKEKVTPLICIPDLEFDFEKREFKKTVDEHVGPFTDRFEIKWGRRPVWIDLNHLLAEKRMSTGSHLFDYIFEGLRSIEANFIPVIRFDSDHDTVEAVNKSTKIDQRGVGLRVRLEKLIPNNSESQILNLASKLSLQPNEVDLIIDLQAPNFTPYQHFAKALISRLKHYKHLSEFRNFILVSSAIPDSSQRIAKGIDEIPRHDWMFYKFLCSELPSEVRSPIYGDYTTVYPKFKADMDMRIIRPAGKIIYTTPSSWATCKGGAFRDDRNQMIEHCKTIVTHPKFQFRGSDFSDGDYFISLCANEEKGPSNLTYWKRVTINHHITTVVDDLANFCDSTSPP